MSPLIILMVFAPEQIGLIKANVAPIMAEQYTPTGDYVETLTTGETVIIDREGTRPTSTTWTLLIT